MLRYKLTKDDWLAFYRYHYATSPTIIRQIRKARWLNTGAIVAGFGVIAYNEIGHYHRSISLAILGTIIAVLFFLFFPKHMKQKSEQQAIKLYNEGKNSDDIGPVQVSYDADGLSISSPRSSGTIKWSSIEKIGSTTTHTFLFVSAVSAIIIPYQRIEEGNIDDLLSEIRNHVTSVGA